ncbi:methanethiol S-methyltransferase [Tautonia plasticadhaerens]|uniref:methanethiol S-methyltransferase n=1 Tax=Tautonia plasticadhaerens TaxID=2527974 RepID=A0A518H9L0_9BACT|nr:methanethiol S-methyltransferase [Tautonia plasticadhaerens]QDV37552.1 NnrU protein [Tautonia plasticadhaerens]
MSRILALAYGVASYLAFLASLLYAVGFVGDFLVPRSVDAGGPRSPLGVAVPVDLLLLGLFAVPHSVMARPWFKRRWTRFVPPSVERSTYVLTSSLLLGLLFWQWRPIPIVVWHVDNPVGRWLMGAIFWAGWALVLVSTFLIDHFDLFGLRQVYLHVTGRPYTPIAFKTPGPYRYVRHPLMTGFLLAFWATPEMTVGHLLFAGSTTAYILIALRFEERDLAGFHGESYEAYREQAGMLLPFPRARKRS